MVHHALNLEWEKHHTAQENICTAINAFQSLVSTLSTDNWCRDGFSVLFAVTFSSYVCITLWSIFPLRFYGSCGLGCPLQLCYGIEAVSRWLLCFIQANIYNWSWTRGFTSAKQCTLWQNARARVALGLWPAHEVDLSLQAAADAMKQPEQMWLMRWKSYILETS